ncbi:hypothetical protein BDB01DRAFT_834078 [Pilobolus umbonatus]|nr:hypothetical protein BDB01DRAFT_834078 [Pilobolus umbonatus]
MSETSEIYPVNGRCYSIFFAQVICSDLKPILLYAHWRRDIDCIFLTSGEDSRRSIRKDKTSVPLSKTSTEKCSLVFPSSLSELMTDKSVGISSTLYVIGLLDSICGIYQIGFIRYLEQLKGELSKRREIEASAYPTCNWVILVNQQRIPLIISRLNEHQRTGTDLNTVMNSASILLALDKGSVRNKIDICYPLTSRGSTIIANWEHKHRTDEKSASWFEYPINL